jgi:hypothetical protein
VARARHPGTLAHYEAVDGLVRVISEDGEGMFKSNGEWVSGQLRTADGAFCHWLVMKAANFEMVRNPLAGR